MSENTASASKPDREAIYQQLRAEIQTGELPVGEILTEVAVSKRFRVSRTPVRDALARLRDAKLIERTTHGLEVKGADPEQVVQVYDLRCMMEEEVAGQAAQNRQMNDVLRLEALLERDQKLDDPDDAEMATTNLEFHGAIWEAAHNPVLLALMKELETHLIHTPRSTLGEGDRWLRSLDQHSLMVAAIRDHKVTEARAIARAHFEEARTIRLDILREQIAAQTLH